MSKLSFNNKNRIFFDALKARVDEYFKTNQLKPTGNIKLYAKLMVLIPSAIALYCLVVFVPVHFGLGLALSGVLGMVTAFIGFNVMHDACHGSYSQRKWINNTLSLSLNAMGGNSYIWKLKHNIVHHTYTNVDGIDDDIHNSPVMRLCESQPLKKMHRYQHLYALAAYAMSSFSWMFFLDFKKYFSRKILNTPLRKMDTKEHIIFWVSKVAYWLFYIALPVYMVGWGSWLAYFFTMHAVMGITIAIVFQLAHVVEKTQFVDAADGDIENEWAVHQLNTTADFATHNKLVSWFLGGLNFQIEHHLFPRISHVHYPAISRIVKETCSEFNIRYNHYRTMVGAVASHFRYMKQLGRA